MPCCYKACPALYCVQHSRSLTEASFTSGLKHATITPIIRNTNLDPKILQTYRLISNTPYLAKVLEKTAFYQINDHLISNELLCPYQSGFKQNHSCEPAIIEIVNDIQQRSPNCGTRTSCGTQRIFRWYA